MIMTINYKAVYIIISQFFLIKESAAQQLEKLQGIEADVFRDYKHEEINFDYVFQFKGNKIGVGGFKPLENPLCRCHGICRILILLNSNNEVIAKTDSLEYFGGDGAHLHTFFRLHDNSGLIILAEVLPYGDVMVYQFIKNDFQKIGEINELWPYTDCGNVCKEDTLSEDGLYEYCGCIIDCLDRNSETSSYIDIYGNNSGKYFEFVFTSEVVIDYSEHINEKDIPAQSIKYIYDGEKFYKQQN